MPTFFFMAGAEEGGGMYTDMVIPAAEGSLHHLFLQTDVLMKFLKIMKDLRVPQLPWAVQEAWGCERVPTEVDAIIIGNDIYELH